MASVWCWAPAMSTRSRPLTHSTSCWWRTRCAAAAVSLFFALRGNLSHSIEAPCQPQVVLVKMNPVNDYSTPFLKDVFLPFIEAGFIHFVRGGADVGAYLCQHPEVDDVHITGSAMTHDIIVWGSTAAEREHNKAADTPKLSKPISSELGGVTPVIVVPGQWSEKELLYQARNVAG